MVGSQCSSNNTYIHVSHGTLSLAENSFNPVSVFRNRQKSVYRNLCSEKRTQFISRNCHNNYFQLKVHLKEMVLMSVCYLLEKLNISVRNQL